MACMHDINQNYLFSCTLVKCPSFFENRIQQIHEKDYNKVMKFLTLSNQESVRSTIHSLKVYSLDSWVLMHLSII